jgi:outer membrane protein
MEASRDVARAIGTNGVQGNLFALYGLSGNASTINESYANTNTQDQEQLQFGITVPILDWGKAHGAIEMAKAQQQLAMTNIKKSKTDFDQEVILDAAEYNLQNQQLIIATKANNVSQRRFYIAKERYLLGKIGITDLNIAQTDRDAAQKSYIDVLRNSWITFYNLRKITLYDFNQQIPLEKEVTGVY